MLNGPTGPSQSLDQWFSGRTELDHGLFFYDAVRPVSDSRDQYIKITYLLNKVI